MMARTQGDTQQVPGDILLAAAHLGEDKVRLIHALLEGIAPEIKNYVQATVQPLRQRIKELEARPPVKYAGVFEVTKFYSAGELVTHDGSLWHCNVACQGGVPGFSPHENWTLAVKRGRDGKGAKS